MAPVLPRRCVSCHRDGSLAPFPLETWDQVRPVAQHLAMAVAARRMPPFPPAQDGDCPPIDDPRVMPDGERDLIARWAAAGAPAGAPQAPGEPPPRHGPPGPPSDRFPMHEPYPSSFTGSDDYRCFVIDPKLSVPVPVSAVSGEPGNRAIVHHASVYAVPPTEAAALRRLDALATPTAAQARQGFIYSAWAHLHLLGRPFPMDLLRPDGSRQCLLHIPSWDFHWQSIYRLKTPVYARPGDRVRVTCEWDNSAENQPLVNGARPAPRDVRFGEKSTDEMCIGSLALTAP